MRKIEKSTITPPKLQEIQSEIAAELAQKKDKFKWQTRHYSDPIKEELKALYHNKCGFCERELSDFDGDNKFTVEHYRPKEHYYWLGNEWTNLFPTCTKCNGNKGSDFPLFSEKKKIKKEDAPFNEENQLIRLQCLATDANLLAEQALFLHPEVDNPFDYFCVDKFGEIKPKKNLSTYDNERAKRTIDKFLKRQNLAELRKKHIENYRTMLTEKIEDFLKYYQIAYTERDIKATFFRFFENLAAAQTAKNEFSLVGFYMLEDMDTFFLDDIEIEYGKDVKELILYAFQLWVDSIP